MSRGALRVTTLVALCLAGACGGGGGGGGNVLRPSVDPTGTYHTVVTESSDSCSGTPSEPFAGDLQVQLEGTEIDGRYGEPDCFDVDMGHWRAETATAVVRFEDEGSIFHPETNEYLCTILWTFDADYVFTRTSFSGPFTWSYEVLDGDCTPVLPGPCEGSGTWAGTRCTDCYEACPVGTRSIPHPSIRP